MTDRRTVLKWSAALAATTLLPVSAVNAQGSGPLRVGFVYVGPVGEAGWTYAHDLGRRAVEAAFPGKVKTTFIESVAEGADAERVIRSLAQDGHGLIFTTSFGYMDATLKVARQFPKGVFQHATGYKTAANLGTYDVRTYEGAYLAGVVAGRMSKSGKLGVVGSHPIPEVIRNINAYTLGARSVNPAASTRVIWVNSWFDPGKERQAALTLLAQGADVLMQNTDSPAVLQAAQEKGAYAFGWDSDMYAYGPKAQLAASEINWGVWYAKVVGEMLEGTFKPQQQVWYGLKEGAIDLGHLGDMLPSDVKQLVAERRQGIIDGSRPVFAGPLHDQGGKEIVAAGKDMDDKDKLAMNDYLAGVEGNVPGGK
ncbi:BMP family ABC transporter substrate-binding protein [Azoarcus sp. L1K30]|uniref:BMP family ABC transporter substrate-binding protein n=1 Tax=Azoarcus sp. L1K30 TaxID=2820277 RepID=UPI001B831DB7|nr:BMP family ABC transporter substrate-binding protein [Azoarcus sp. L1K30]MBR0567677.1 BMP family ABC transporter substrate-binding protein [Azoarcus sp. L1K30]